MRSQRSYSLQSKHNFVAILSRDAVYDRCILVPEGSERFTTMMCYSSACKTDDLPVIDYNMYYKQSSMSLDDIKMHIKNGHLAENALAIAMAMLL